MQLHLRFKPAAGERAAGIVGDQPPAIVEALAALGCDGCDEAAVTARVLDRGGVDAMLRWQHVLGICREENLLDYPVQVNRRWFATVEPLAPGFDMPGLDDASRPQSRLSRFAYVRRDGGRTLLESPLAPVRLELAPSSVAPALGARGTERVRAPPTCSGAWRPRGACRG